MSDGLFVNINGVWSATSQLFVPGLGYRTTRIVVPALGTYTPDLRAAVEHNIDCQGDLTINDPIPFALSTDFSLLLITHVRNVSGGAIVVTWGGKYSQPAFVAPADGSGVIGSWHYDRSADKWYSLARQTVPN